MACRAAWSTSTIPRSCWAARQPRTKKLFLSSRLPELSHTPQPVLAGARLKSLDSWTASQEPEGGWHGLPSLFP